MPLTKAAALIALLAPSVLAQAPPQTTADRADAVVIAEIASGQQTGTSASFTLRVSRTLKGGIPAGATIPAEWKQAPKAKSPRQLSGNYGMWFLTSGQAGVWELLPYSTVGQRPIELTYYPVPAGGTPALVQPGLSPSDMMVAELEPAVEQLGNLQPNAQLYDAGLGVLSAPNSATTLAAYHRLAASANKNVRLVGLIGLIRTGDVSSLLAAPRTQADCNGITFGGALASAIRGLRAASPAVVNALGLIATDSNAVHSAKANAAEALRTIHTKESLPWLAALLSEPETDLQNMALAGLSSFVENLPITTPDKVANFTWMRPQGSAPFRSAAVEPYLTISGQVHPPEKQPEYVAFWKAWWQSNRVQLSGN